VLTRLVHALAPLTQYQQADLTLQLLQGLHQGTVALAGGGLGHTVLKGTLLRRLQHEPPLLLGHPGPFLIKA